MADTNKVVPLPPGEEIRCNDIAYKWTVSGSWFMHDPSTSDSLDCVNESIIPAHMVVRKLAYLDQQAQAQQDTAHTDTEPVKDGWIAYDAIDGVTYHDTYKEALEACYGSLEWFRDEARTSREWDDDAAGVWLARIVERSCEELCEEMGFSDFNMRPVAHTDWQARAEAAELAIGETCDLLGEGGDGTLFGRAESVLSDLHAYKEALDRLLYAVQRHRKAIVQDANMALAEWADVTIEITKAYALMRKESDEKSL